MVLSLEDIARSLKALALPAIAVDLAAFDANAAIAEKWAAKAERSLPIRVATKSIRVPALIQRVLARGPAWKGVMCFAAGEVELLHRLGVDDFLLAYPVVHPRELKILRDVVEAGATVAVVVDCVAHVEALERALAGCDHVISVVVDVDASLRAMGAHVGVRRSGVRTKEAVEALFDRCQSPQVRPVGIMAYEAQVAGLPDDSAHHRQRNLAAKGIRTLSVRAVARRRQNIVDHLRDRGHTLTLVNGGGTGSLDSSPNDRALTEVTMGSGLLCPHSFDGFSNVKMTPACFFGLSVTRSSDPGFVTCAGGGYVASGPFGRDRLPLPVHPPGLTLLDTEGAGEVQTPLRCGGVAPALDDVVLFRHAKAGEVMERFAAAALVESAEGTPTLVPTYRGLGGHFF